MMRLGRRVAAPAKSLLNRRTMSTQPKVSAPVDWWTFGAGAVFASAFIMINQDGEAGEEAHATTANVLSEAAITSQSKFSLSVLSDAANLQKILVAGGMTEVTPSTHRMHHVTMSCAGRRCRQSGPVPRRSTQADQGRPQLVHHGDWLLGAWKDRSGRQGEPSTFSVEEHSPLWFSTPTTLEADPYSEP